MLGDCIHETDWKLCLLSWMGYSLCRVCTPSDWFTSNRIHPCLFKQAVSPVSLFETSSDTSSIERNR